MNELAVNLFMFKKLQQRKEKCNNSTFSVKLIQELKSDLLWLESMYPDLEPGLL